MNGIIALKSPCIIMYASSKNKINFLKNTPHSSQKVEMTQKPVNG
jgi:hypothetical protein